MRVASLAWLVLPVALGLACGGKYSQTGDEGDEGRTSTLLTFNKKSTAVAIDDVLDDGETEPGSALVVPLFPLDAKKTLCKSRQEPACNSRPGVLNANVSV